MEFENDESPILIIREVAKAQNLDPSMMMHVLLATLSAFHTMHCRSPLIPGAKKHDLNVFNEVRGLMHLGGKSEVPKSLLESILLALQNQLRLQDHNSKNLAQKAAEAGNDAKAAEAESMAYGVKLNAAMQTILKRYVNAVERRTIKEDLAFEQFAKTNPMLQNMKPLPDKFEGFDILCAEAKANGSQAVIIAAPQVIGDNFEDMVSNLNKLASAGLALQIVPPDQRK